MMCSALNGFSTRGCPGILNLTSPGLPVMKRTGIGRSEQIDWTAVIPQPGLSWTSAVIRSGHWRRADAADGIDGADDVDRHAASAADRADAIDASDEAGTR